MELTIDGPRLSFKTVEKMLFPGSKSRKFVGPPAPITDPRLCAGLLFERWNDGTRRSISNRPGEWPAITLDIHDEPRFYVRREVVKLLLEEGVLEGTPEWGYTDMERLRLSDQGKRIVVKEWFTDQSFFDKFCAGASQNIETGEVSWPRV